MRCSALRVFRFRVVWWSWQEIRFQYYGQQVRELVILFPWNWSSHYKKIYFNKL